MARKLNIYLFRHGQTTYNRDEKFTGWHDPKLTKLGINQSKILANKLKNKKFQVAFYTKLVRSKQTLNKVLKHHPECKKRIEDNRLIERNYGKLNGTSHNRFIRNIGKREYNLLREGDAIENLSIKRRKEVEKFLGENEYKTIHRGFNIPPPGGESFADIEKRVKSFITYLLKLMKKEKVNVAISAHGNSIRLFRKIMEKASTTQTISWIIPYDKVYIYSIKT